MDEIMSVFAWSVNIMMTGKTATAYVHVVDITDASSGVTWFILCKVKPKMATVELEPYERHPTSWEVRPDLYDSMAAHCIHNIAT